MAAVARVDVPLDEVLWRRRAAEAFEQWPGPTDVAAVEAALAGDKVPSRFLLLRGENEDGWRLDLSYGAHLVEDLLREMLRSFDNDTWCLAYDLDAPTARRWRQIVPERIVRLPQERAPRTRAQAVWRERARRIVKAEASIQSYMVDRSGEDPYAELQRYLTIERTDGDEDGWVHYDLSLEAVCERIKDKLQDEWGFHALYDLADPMAPALPVAVALRTNVDGLVVEVERKLSP